MTTVWNSKSGGGKFIWGLLFCKKLAQEHATACRDTQTRALAGQSSICVPSPILDINTDFLQGCDSQTCALTVTVSESCVHAMHMSVHLRVRRTTWLSGFTCISYPAFVCGSRKLNHEKLPTERIYTVYILYIGRKEWFSTHTHS